jgi:hypothetical protein
MPARIGPTIVKLALVSLVVGLLISFFEIDPRNLLAGLGETARDLFEMAASALEWSIQYILLGAVVVVPVWALLALAKTARRKKPVRDRPGDAT